MPARKENGSPNSIGHQVEQEDLEARDIQAGPIDPKVVTTPRRRRLFPEDDIVIIRCCRCAVKLHPKGPMKKVATQTIEFGEYEVDEILGIRVKHGILQVLVKWTGYTERTWTETAYEHNHNHQQDNLF